MLSKAFTIINVISLNTKGDTCETSTTSATSEQQERELHK